MEVEKSTASPLFPSVANPFISTTVKTETEENVPEVKNESIDSSVQNDKKLGDEVFPIEKILKKRKKNGRAEYLIKWEGYPESESTWVMRKNILDEQLLNEFECEWISKKRKKLELQKMKLANGEKLSNNNNDINNVNNTNTADTDDTKHVNVTNVERFKIDLDKNVGWQFGDEVEEIIGAKLMPLNAKDQLMFLIKWKGKDMCTLVPSYEANERIPQTVIAFYEKRIRFSHTLMSSSNIH